jgi:hypothetical protein
LTTWSVQYFPEPNNFLTLHASSQNLSWIYLVFDMGEGGSSSEFKCDSTLWSSLTIDASYGEQVPFEWSGISFNLCGPQTDDQVSSNSRVSYVGSDFWARIGISIEGAGEREGSRFEVYFEIEDTID